MQLKIKKSSYFWNTFSGFVNASEAVVVLAVVNRVSGSIDAGILTFAFSLSNLAMAIGKFGMRALQVTDAKEENTFAEYCASRVCTFFLMVLFVLVYILFSFCLNNYSAYKCHVIILLFLLYSVEVVEDAFLSEYQRIGRLDLGSKMFSIRWIISLFALCFLSCFINLRVALSVSVIVSFITLILFLMHYNRKLSITLDKKVFFKCFNKIFELLINATPLFISSFAYLFLNNIQKFAIDRYLTESEQAAFGYIIMPVFVIPLLSSFVIQPALVSVTNAYNRKKYGVFNKSIRNNILFLLAMLLVCEFGAFVAGVPVLNMIYKTNLAMYKYDLQIILLGGSFLALANYMSVLLTIMRLQKLSMYIYLVGAVIGAGSAYVFTCRYGIHGSSFSYLITVFVTSVLFVATFFLAYKKALKR